MSRPVPDDQRLDAAPQPMTWTAWAACLGLGAAMIAPLALPICRVDPTLAGCLRAALRWVAA